MGQGCNTRTLLLTDCSQIILAPLLILLLSGIERPKFVVPIGLQGIGYQPVRGVHVKIPSLGCIGFVSGALDCFLAQSVYLIESGLNLLLHSKRDFQR
jgi:hypothetical protein